MSQQSGQVLLRNMSSRDYAEVQTSQVSDCCKDEEASHKTHREEALPAHSCWTAACELESRGTSALLDVGGLCKTIQ